VRQRVSEGIDSGPRATAQLLLGALLTLAGAAVAAPPAPVPASVAVSLDLAALHPAVTRGSLVCGALAQPLGAVGALVDYDSFARLVLSPAHYQGQSGEVPFTVAGRAFKDTLTFATKVAAPAASAGAPPSRPLIACWLTLNGRPAVLDQGAGLRPVFAEDFASVDAPPQVAVAAGAAGQAATAALAVHGTYFVPGGVALSANAGSAASAAAAPADVCATTAQGPLDWSGTIAMLTTSLETPSAASSICSLAASDFDLVLGPASAPAPLARVSRGSDAISPALFALAAQPAPRTVLIHVITGGGAAPPGRVYRLQNAQLQAIRHATAVDSAGAKREREELLFGYQSVAVDAPPDAANASGATAPAATTGTPPAATAAAIDGSFVATLALRTALSGLAPAVTAGAWACSARAGAKPDLDAELAKIDALRGQDAFFEFQRGVEYRAHYLGQQQTLPFPVASGARSGSDAIAIKLSSLDLQDPASKRLVAAPGVLFGCWLKLTNAAGVSGFARQAAAAPGVKAAADAWLQVGAKPYVLLTAAIQGL